MKKNKKIYIAGHNGMVGSAIVRALRKDGYDNLILKSKIELNLLDVAAVQKFFAEEKPEIVILAAARVGGIKANMDYPAEFLYENLVIQNNVIHQSYQSGVENFCFLGSSCIYPRECSQPIKEDYLLSGLLEPTNEGYAIAKIAGLKLIEFYKKQYHFNGMSLMPCNLYGTNDSFDPQQCHVLSALVKKMVDAAQENEPNVNVWGSGKAKREFMHVNDAAEAVLFYLNNPINSSFMNVGWGIDITIKDLAEKIAALAGYKGELHWDISKPDGVMQKCLDISKMNETGFKPKILLDDGIKMLIDEYKQKKLYENGEQP
jgi:GDP-L-fucose synthase